MAARIERDLLGVGHPVEVPPDLAPEHARGPQVLAAARGSPPGSAGARRRACRACPRDCGGRRTSGRQPEKIAARSRRDARVAGPLDVRARVGELQLYRVAAEPCGLALLLAPHGLHLLVGVGGVAAGPRGSRAVRHDDAAERLAGLVEAVADAGLRHDLDVVLVGRDAQVRHPPEGLVRRPGPARERKCRPGGGRISWVTIWNRPGRGASPQFRRSTGRLAAAIAWPWRLSFSSGMRTRVRDATSGNSAASTSRALRRMPLAARARRDAPGDEHMAQVVEIGVVADRVSEVRAERSRTPSPRGGRPPPSPPGPRPGAPARASSPGISKPARSARRETACWEKYWTPQPASPDHSSTGRVRAVVDGGEGELVEPGRDVAAGPDVARRPGSSPWRCRAPRCRRGTSIRRARRPRRRWRPRRARPPIASGA